MKEQNKTRRFFDLILWLQKSGSAGVSRERIMEEYGISEKTFLRDIEELEELLPLGLRYDREEKRLYGSLGGDAAGLVPLESQTPNQQELQKTSEKNSALTNQNINLFSGKKPEGYLLHLTPTRLRLGERELETLFEAVLSGSAVEFFYRGKLRRAAPLFFCYYAERWYLFAWMMEGSLILKFRLDQIEKVALPLVGASAAGADIAALKKESARKIRDSHNIFVDLNATSDLQIDFRFFFSEAFLRDEMGKYVSISRPDPAEANVTDIRLSFSAYSEARMFMNKWLGRFQILGPETIRKRYLEELEEAMDVI